MGKRGPQRKSGQRELNGRLDRKAAPQRNLANLGQEEVAMLDTGLTARERVHGIAPINSRAAEAGSVVGRLQLAGRISRIQYDAAMTYLKEARAYSIAMFGPRHPGAIDLNATKGSSDYENVPRVREAKRRYVEAERAICAASVPRRDRCSLLEVTRLVVIEDRPVRHLTVELSRALNVLSRHYGLV